MPNLLGVRPSFATGFAQSPGESEYPELWRGLVATYDPSLGQTGGRLIDWSGKLNHGTFVNSPTWVSGKFGSAINFDSGNSDRIDCGEPGWNMNEISVVVWFKTDQIAADFDLLGIKDLSVLRMKWDVGLTRWECFFGDDTDWSVALGTHTPTVGKWTHFVFTKAVGGQIQVVLDGIRVGNIPTLDDNIVTPVGHQLEIGFTTAYFDGLIGQVLIYNRALIPAEIFLLNQLRKQVA